MIRQVANPIAFSLFEVKTVLADLYPPISDQQPKEGQRDSVLEESDLPGRKPFVFRKSNFHLLETAGVNAQRPAEPASEIHPGGATGWRCLVRPGQVFPQQSSKVSHWGV